jgi:hypothetical protein
MSSSFNINVFKDTISFVHTSNPYTFISNSKFLTLNLDLSGNNNIVKLVSMSRGFHTDSGAISFWKTLSTIAASGAVPRPRINYSKNTGLLLVLLCFLASSEIPLDLLYRGGSPRRRWNIHDGIEKINTLHIGLSSTLVDLLSSIAKLNNAFGELMSLSAISKYSNQTYIINRAVQVYISDNLPPELHSFWKLQALVVAYRSIP